MKILLIMPDAQMHKLKLGPYIRSMREMPLSICTLASLTPDYPDIDIRLIDGSVEKIPLDYDADLVGISVITGCANRAYAIADHYREKNIPVVLGGVHVTLLPGEAIQHADSIVIGRAEQTWPQLIEDFRSAQLKDIYQEHMLRGNMLTDIPPPRRDLHRRFRYMLPDAVQATRGCNKGCDFCTVPAVWPKFLKRPVEDVINDIRQTRGKYIAFNDVSIAEDVDYAKELFKAMIPLGKRWGGLATTSIMKDPELLQLMKKSGCVYLLFGFESNDRKTLTGMGKGFNLSMGYDEIMNVMKELRISVQGCFVFGFDHDTKEIFASTVERINQLGIDIPRFSLYTPYPGSLLFKRLLKEKRILSFNWDDYDTMHVVIKPAQMSPEELYQGFKWAYRETFKIGHINKRMKGLSCNSVINFFGNLTYKIFVRRLFTEQKYAAPYSIDNPGISPGENLYRDNFLQNYNA